jgi:hypothetical protein
VGVLVERDCAPGTPRDLRSWHHSPEPQRRSNRRISHFNQAELAFRWRISPRTLERWRCSKTGPIFLKIGGRVIYRLEDIEAFEKASIRHTVAMGTPNAGKVHMAER